MSIDVYDLIDPARYAERGYPHDAWTTLRNEDPVAYFHAEGWKPFWAITKHADVLEIAKQPLKFSSAQGITLLREGIVIPPSEILVLLDPPKHAPVRRVANGRFTPKAVREQKADIERIASETMGAVRGTEIDFVDDVAAPFPLGVIAWILGVPPDQWANLFRWTNEVIGKDDPEYRREGESPGKTIKRARGEVHAYFRELIAERRADPQDDLVSELLRGEVERKELNEEQLVSYCELLVEAGNETTRNAISGGLLAFSESPGTWERLRTEPARLPDAVEEILRWVSPISHFTRVATEDYELRGKMIKAGEQVALYFASANRDEEVFDDPFAFRSARKPNPPISFGFGEHFCMGAHVARVEIETIFRHLLARMQSFDVTGTVERLSSITNGSIKHLPITFTTSSASGTNGDDS
jgi:cholest-4-en-3-one 26-monooxygenase